MFLEIFIVYKCLRKLFGKSYIVLIKIGSWAMVDTVRAKILVEMIGGGDYMRITVYISLEDCCLR